ITPTPGDGSNTCFAYSARQSVAVVSLHGANGTGRKCSPPPCPCTGLLLAKSHFPSRLHACTHTGQYREKCSTPDDAATLSQHFQRAVHHEPKISLLGFKLPCVLCVLLPLFQGHALASSGSGGSSSDSVTVSLLVCLLLLLLLLLFLAWRRLSYESEGRYHPRTLMRSLYLRWQEFRGEAATEELSQVYQEERDEELGEQQQDDTDEEEEQQQQLQKEDNKQEEGEGQIMLSKKADPESSENIELPEPSEEDGGSRATEGSAEALLSDLHSFSGTAAWEDTGKLHVTAL
ncbi:protein tyrosine phosphatase receptor type C-associated protein, partial [Hemicordylus capensis]|uniref:protein tyrosine phosphatase receptor type C-associated protein n=1 Tax=Hemicordylus capensis TaxID=884348 RepID=UPI002303BC42